MTVANASALLKVGAASTTTYVGSFVTTGSVNYTATGPTEALVSIPSNTNTNTVTINGTQYSNNAASGGASQITVYLGAGQTLTVSGANAQSSGQLSVRSIQ